MGWSWMISAAKKLVRSSVQSSVRSSVRSSVQSSVRSSVRSSFQSSVNTEKTVSHVHPLLVHERFLAMIRLQTEKTLSHVHPLLVHERFLAMVRLMKPLHLNHGLGLTLGHRYFTSKGARLSRKERSDRYVCWYCMEKYDVPFVYKDGEEGFEMAQDRGYTTSSEVVVPDVYWAMVNGRKEKIYLKYNSRNELAIHYKKVHKIVKGSQWKCCRRCNNIFHKKVEFHICIASDDQLKEEFRKRKEVTKDDGSEKKEEEITKDDGCEKEEEPEDWMNIESEEELEEKVKSESVEFHICIASDDQLKITKDDGSEKKEEEIMKDDGCEKEEETEDKMKSESEEELEEKVKSGSED